jgi:hypothetical protein
MGIIVSVYRNNHGDCTNGGMSSKADNLCIVNAPGPFKPDAYMPAAILDSHVKGCVRIIPAVQDVQGNWIADRSKHYMMGGNYAATSDSRFNALVRKLAGSDFYGAVAIHDRAE